MEINRTSSITKVLSDPYPNHCNIISKHLLIRRNRISSIIKVLAEPYPNRGNGISEQTQREISTD